MKRQMLCILLILLCLLAGGCLPQGEPSASGGTPPVSHPAESGGTLPAEDGEEMRAVWLSYVELNRLLSVDTVEAVQAALDEVMDNCVSYGVNAVMFHVRANSDAYYASSLFGPAAAAAPWLDAGFDPLAYAVQAAHSRGLELHAWVNPYRVGAKEENKRCDDVFSRTVGDAPVWYYVPSSASVQKLILDGIRELLRYDIDGVQFDDYFYPTGLMSPQAEAFEAECTAADAQGVAEWRRCQGDALVASVCAVVHQKAGCVFGISPSYDLAKTRDSMYADVGRWMAQKGYVDYICPQLYVGFENTSAGFAEVLETWAAYPRDPSVKLYIGLALYKTGLGDDAYAGDGRKEWNENGDIMSRSVQAVRDNPACSGVMLYSYSFFDPDMARSGPYDREMARQEAQGLIAALKAGS